MGKKKVDGVMLCTKADKPANIDGSTKDKCGKCSCDVWVSPASRNQIEGYRRQGAHMIFVCPDCGLNHIRDLEDSGKELTLGEPTEEMAKEFNEQLKKDLN